MATSTQQISVRLRRLLDHQQQSLLCGGLKGIEKESLRISPSGIIAQTPHPVALGSALTHSIITTDYSEALLEFITPPFAHTPAMLAKMQHIHQFVYQHLASELLLAASMPCGIDDDLSVPIAYYGTSNVGKMKHIYRHGLWHRYGRSMQAIAGIHFNYSVPEHLWPALYVHEQTQDDLQQFINEAYLGLVRNFQKIAWLILYLFGASPAICKSFFNSRPALRAQFDEFDAHTLYHPYATSLRMSDIGYKSKSQEALNINYNSLTGYVDSLTQAISTPYPEYQNIGVKRGDEYLQLNANILQIENEFYSTMRPKQVIQSGERPTLALQRRGVRYVEMRALDLNIYHPIGIELSTAYFLEALLLTCLLRDSPAYTRNEVQINNNNQITVAHQGRKPGLLLLKEDHTIPLNDWAIHIFAEMQPVCAILDAENPSQPYTQALNLQQQLIANPDLTPSARILSEMRSSGQCFGAYALQHSLAHKQHFLQQPLETNLMAEFSALAQNSLAKQQQLEANPQEDFATYLARYFA